MANNRFLILSALVAMIGLGSLGYAIGDDNPPYAKFQNLGHPVTALKDVPFSMCTSYLFDRQPVNNFVVIFQIVDEKGVVYQIHSLSVDKTNAYRQTTISGSYYKMDACSSAIVDSTGTYSIETFALTDDQNPIPVSDIGNNSVAVD